MTLTNREPRSRTWIPRYRRSRSREGKPCSKSMTSSSISVDDHLIEPPDLFVNHLDAKYLDRAPKLVRNDEGSDVWTFGELVDGDRGAQRRRRSPQGGVRPGAAEPRRGAARLLRRPRAGEGHGRRRRAGLDELPVVPHLHGPHVPQRRHRPVERPGAGLQRLAHRRVVRRLPRPLHPDGRAGDLGRRRRPPPRSAARRPRAATRSASPRTRPRSATPASTTSTGTRCGRRASTPAPSCRSTSGRRAGCRSRPSTRRPT